MLLTSTELAKKWNISSRRISSLCAEGRLNGAFKKGKIWLIPNDVQKPTDLRINESFYHCEELLLTLRVPYFL